MALGITISSRAKLAYPGDKDAQVLGVPIWEFPKIGDRYFGVLIIGVLTYPIFGNSHLLLMPWTKAEDVLGSRRGEDMTP